MLDEYFPNTEMLFWINELLANQLKMVLFIWLPIPLFSFKKIMLHGFACRKCFFPLIPMTLNSSNSIGNLDLSVKFIRKLTGVFNFQEKKKQG